ncbi:MAG: T9SS type A sorting domain-containing protein [Bacteroidetes bacterium]|nr:T9SS type A sorting domain-containing protein [Bacteroidota bacterium]
MKIRFIVYLSLLFLYTSSIFAGSTKIIAHRGASSVAPENTLSAFSKAIEFGADYIECDVQVSKEDSLMIMHDATVDRTTNSLGAVNSLSYNVLRVLDAGSWFSPQFAGEKIPTLKEVLNLAANANYNVGVVIEIKANTPTIVAKVVALVQKLNLRNRVIISSFSFDQISAAKAIDPTIPVQLFAGAITNTNITQVAGIGGEWVGSGGTITTALLESAHANNVLLNKWTVNSAPEMQVLIAQGVDAITTNFPQTAKALMDETPPSDVQLNDAIVKSTKVKLSWNASVDLESGIAGYEIYRDTTANAQTLLISVDDTTNYIDETRTESTKFYYRIKAKNLAGLTSANFSNEIIAETEKDNEAPKVGFISSHGPDNQIIVEFNELIDSSSAVNVANYIISEGVTVNSIKLGVNSKTVFLTTSTLSENVSYILTVKGVKDLAVNPNIIIEPLTVEFTHSNFLPGLVAFWNYDEGDGETSNDISGNSNNGTLKNGLFWSEGYTGNGLTFDGVDDFVNIPASSSLDINTNAVSVSIWTKLGQLPNEIVAAFGPLFDSETDNYVLYEDKGNNELRFKVTTSNSAERPGIPAADLVKNKWIHVVGVYDGTKAMIYLNGVMKDYHILTGTVKPGQVANIGLNGTAYFKGSMDDVQIFNRALSESEVNFLYKGVKQAIVDIEAPVLTSVSAIGSDQKIIVEFNEQVDQNSAVNKDNYTIDNGIVINSIQPVVGDKSVILFTSPLSTGVLYTLTVSNISDQADEPNTLSSDSKHFSHKKLLSGLVSYWSMDEGADTTVYDASANGNNISLENGVQWSAGRSGNGLNFDGVDDIARVPNSTSLDIDTTGVTLSLWVNLDYLPTEMPSNVGPIYDSPTDNYVLYEDKGNKELRFKVTTTSGAERPGIPVADLVVGEWIHVAGVYDGNSAKIYMNGELKDTHLNLTGNVKPGQIATLGRDGSWKFSGGIDEIQVYRRGLSEQEIKYLYSGISIPKLSLNEVEETTVKLKWQYEVDPAIGISGFNIYRDTTSAPSILIASVADTNEYNDFTKAELTGYYYRIKAIDGSGVESDYFSNDVYVETKTDVTSPTLIYVTTTGEQGKVLVKFSEEITESSATTVSNYSLDKSAKVDSAKITFDFSGVILNVSGLSKNETYTLTMNNIIDRAITPNSIVSDTKGNFKNYAFLPNLIAYLPLDEGRDTVAYDVSGYANHGSIANQPTWVGGKYGNALRFDGIDDYVEIPNSPSLNIDTNGVSISIFVKLDYLPQEMPTGVGPIYDSGLDRYVIYVDKGNKELRFKVTTASGAERPGIPENMLVKNEWMHIVGVYDGSMAMIYMNGELMDTHSNITGNVKPDQVARLGQDGTNYFKGELDNVQIYNRGLSADEVKALYTGDLVVTSVEENIVLPLEYSLSQNYPNPFNPSTVINYSVVEKGNVKLVVYDLLGRKITELINDYQNPGKYTVTWNGLNNYGASVASGIYFYQITAGKFVDTKKMMLVR